jgi:hypothetical protein
MVHVAFDPSIIGYADFVQEGAGVEEPTYFRGLEPCNQRGYGIQTGAGIGSIFQGLWRFFLPVLRRVGTTVGEEALNSGQRVMDKLKQGESLKSALSSESKRGIDNVMERGGFERPFQSGKGIKRGRKRVLLPKHQTLIGSIRKKRVREDAFGLY